MNKQTLVLVVLGLTSLCATCKKAKNSPVPPSNNAGNTAVVWQTKADQSVLLSRQDKELAFGNTSNSYPAIMVNDATTYQTVDGFGYTLTGGSAALINRLSETSKTALLQELFGNDNNSIGVSYLRLSIGASDLDSAVFSYNDLPAGQTDIAQAKFSIQEDKKNLVPVLKAILAINPAIKIIATPWSPPVWMKDNNSSIGGSLRPEYYTSYATYFVKYIQAMKAEGIVIDAITPQNEPYHPGNNPSLFMTATQQRDFIKNSLGPAFMEHHINTKVVLYDHNLDKPYYADTIYNDPQARKYIDGTAFHLYAGDIQAMGELHDRHPDKNVYFTEQWTGSTSAFDGDFKWHIKNVMIGSMRNWGKIALEWNLANNPSFGPHTPGGCTQCKGAITINGDQYTRNVAYYIIGQVSKFVPAGSKRIESSELAGLSNVAFLTPSGKKVMVVLNEQDIAVNFNLKYNNQWAPVMVDANSALTIIW